jgi:SH3 domain-containing YSC84-like protein 1
MKTDRSISKWFLGAGAAIALLAPWTWAQDQPTTTSPGVDTTTKQQQKAEQKEEKREDNTAKFDTKSKEGSTDIVKRLNNSASVLDEIMQTPDKGIPQDILKDAKCIAVIPSMINIAVGFGGRHGKGVATCRTTHGWSAPAPITITGGSWGLQIGGQATDLVMLIMNQRGMDHLLSSKFKIGAEATGAAGPVGRQVEGSTDWKMKAEVLTYSRARGIFAGIDLNGASIKQDKDETALLYEGKFIPFQQILSGHVTAPASAGTFLSTVRKYAREADEKQGE